MHTYCVIFEKKIVSNLKFIYIFENKYPADHTLLAGQFENENLNRYFTNFNVNNENNFLIHWMGISMGTQ